MDSIKAEINYLQKLLKNKNKNDNVDKIIATTNKIKKLIGKDNETNLSFNLTERKKNKVVTINNIDIDRMEDMSPIKSRFNNLENKVNESCIKFIEKNKTDNFEMIKSKFKENPKFYNIESIMEKENRSKNISKLSNINSYFNFTKINNNKNINKNFYLVSPSPIKQNRKKHSVKNSNKKNLNNIDYSFSKTKKKKLFSKDFDISPLKTFRKANNKTPIKLNKNLDFIQINDMKIENYSKYKKNKKDMKNKPNITKKRDNFKINKDFDFKLKYSILNQRQDTNKAIRTRMHTVKNYLDEQINLYYK